MSSNNKMHMPFSKYKTSSQIKLVELYPNIEVLEHLFKINKTDDALLTLEVDKKDYTQMQKIYKALSKNQHNRMVTYSRPSYDKGRYFANNLGLQTIDKRFRRLILNGEYNELDLVNSHPSILLSLCKHYNIEKYDTLTDYVNNRDKHLDNVCTKYDVTRKQAKQLFLILSYGGTFDTWKKESKLKCSIKSSDFIDDFTDELSNISTDAHGLFYQYHQYVQIAKDYKNKTYKAIYTSALAIYLQHIESQIVHSMYEYLLSIGITINTIIHDSVLISTDYDDIDLNDVKKYILEQTGIDIELNIKPTEPLKSDNDFYDKLLSLVPLPITNDDIIPRHEVVRNHFLDFFANKIFDTADMGIMIYDDKYGIWERHMPNKDNDPFYRIIHKYWKEIWFWDYSPDELDYYLNNGKKWDFMQEYKMLKKDLFPHVVQIPKLCNDESIGFLPFENGVLDMYNFKMLPFDPKYRFTKRIYRSFDCTYDFTNDISTLFNRMFDKQYINTEKRDYFLEMLSRGVAGEYHDKRFIMSIGESNCGKGKLVSLCKTALENFVGEFNLEHFLAKKNADMESERTWTFLCDIWDTRLQFSNECTMATDTKGNVIPLDGNKIKKYVSGGDTIPCRLLYSNSIKVKNKGLPVFLVNDAPKVQPADQAYLNRANYITVDRTSNSNITEDTDTYFQTDTTIDAYVENITTGDAFITVMCQYYKKSCVCPMNKPAYVIHESIERSEASEQGDMWIKNNFNIYQGDIQSWKNQIGKFDWKLVGNNFIPIDDIYKDYINDNSIISKTKLSSILTGKLKREVQVKKCNGKAKRVVVGIAYFNDLDELDEDADL